MLGLPHLRWSFCYLDAFSVGVLFRNAVWTCTPLFGTQPLKSSGVEESGKKECGVLAIGSSI